MNTLSSVRFLSLACFVFLNTLALPTLAQGQNESSDDGVIVPREGWVIAGGRGSRGRVALPTDEIEWAWINGELKLPEPGSDESPSATDLASWRRIDGDENGNFSDRALRNGWLVTYVNAPQEQVYVLEARGHVSVLVNGERRGGDVYSHGFVQLPVLLKEGQNTLMFNRARGSIGVKLRPADKSVYFSLADTTAPDFIRGESEDLWCGILVVNATNETVDTYRVAASGEGFASTATIVPSLPPLSVRKVAVRLVPDSSTIVSADDAESLTIHLQLSSAEAIVDEVDVQLGVREPSQKHRRTFVSSIDGSVQYYAVVPPLEGTLNDEIGPGLVLTLHGAGVEGQGQANAYSPKSNIYIVAPTNRRKFGFDWEDWGRWDALEVLALASERFATNPQRTYLTGHSMGGHGTWHIGSLFPDRFAAIGPSAGWISFTTYVGGESEPSEDPKEQLLRGAAIGSDTLARVKNLHDPGVYILHGDADDNVPVDQARTMRRELANFHPDFVYKEQPGAGHWWGNLCVDWPPMFRFFADHELPLAGNVRTLEFVSPSPVISPTCYWGTVAAQFHPGQISRLDLRFNPSESQIVGTTENVRRLKLDLSTLREKDSEQPTLDSITLTLDEQDPYVVAVSNLESLWLERDDNGWHQINPPAADEKGPHRGGFFKEAFNHRFVLVYGTQGSAEENAWMLSRARFDAESFWYRGNGSVDVISDQQWESVATPDRSVIVYGNASINAAWAVLLAESPIQVQRDEWSVEQTASQQESACVWMVRPRADSDVTSVGAVGGTDLKAMQATDRAPYFSSGTGYPDVLITTPDYLLEGSAAIKLGGYFDIDWSVPGGSWVESP